jgi:hypothetical protein
LRRVAGKKLKTDLDPDLACVASWLQDSVSCVLFFLTRRFSEHYLRRHVHMTISRQGALHQIQDSTYQDPSVLAFIHANLVLDFPPGSKHLG